MYTIEITYASEVDEEFPGHRITEKMIREHYKGQEIKYLHKDGPNKYSVTILTRLGDRRVYRWRVKKESYKISLNGRIVFSDNPGFESEASARKYLESSGLSKEITSICYIGLVEDGHILA